MTQLSEEFQEGRAHTQRVRPHLVAMGHTADIRDTETTRICLSMVDRIVNVGAWSSVTPMEEEVGVATGVAPAAPRMAANSEDHADATILCANMLTCIGSKQVHKAQCLDRCATVPNDALKVTGPEARRSFVQRFDRVGGAVCQRGGLAFAELRDVAGQWREFNSALATGAAARLFFRQGPLTTAGCQSYHWQAADSGGCGEVAEGAASSLGRAAGC